MLKTPSWAAWVYRPAAPAIRGLQAGSKLSRHNRSSTQAMRIPLISKIRLGPAAVFATVIFSLQVLEGTNLYFAGLCWAYVLLSTVAFNAAGGFIYPSGWFIFFNAALTSIVGVTYKVLLVEPGDSHLQAPLSTMMAYCVGMLTTLFVVLLVRKLRPRRGLLSGMGFGEDMKKAALGAFILGGMIQLLTYRVQESGSFLSAVRQINNFTQMSILLATFYQVKKSAGKESTNWIVWTAGVSLFILGGLLGFSKYGLLVSIVTWLSAAIAAGHNFSRKQVIGVALAFIFFQMYLVPYSQVGRDLREEEPTMATDLVVARTMLSNLGKYREQYKIDQRELSEDDTRPHLYDRAQGFFDRLNMLSPDDALIAYTNNGNEEGLLPTWWSIMNVVPHFIWRNKPFYYVGNLYAREIGMISDDNDSTGISFSPVADAYHQASFFGVFLVVPPTLFLLFLVMDSLSGDIREAPWGILFCVLVTHAAPEGMIGGQIYIATYVAFGVTVIALLSRYVLPVLSGFLTNSDRTRVRKTVDFKPVIRPRSEPLGITPDPAVGNS